MNRSAVRLIVLLGVVSLLADVTYEGARSVSGPFLATLGAGAMVVGVVAGAGELIGHGLRLASGYLTDRTRRYWLIAFAGYVVNLAAVPLLALAGRWEVAALLLVAERTGKAIRTPARDVMLAQASSRAGHGWGFGLHEAMDQIGAVAGPLLVAWAFATRGGYRAGFAMLAVPAVLALMALAIARIQYPNPQALEEPPTQPAGGRLPRPFWGAVAGASLVAAGFADFPLLAFHLKRTAAVPEGNIPILYAFAMGVDAAAALIFGRLFDRFGTLALAAGAVLAAASTPLVLFGTHTTGLACWGAAMGAVDSIFKAAVARTVPSQRRGSAYGIFHTAYGVAWFLGSAIMGGLYNHSPLAMAVFSTTFALAAVPLLLKYPGP